MAGTVETTLAFFSGTGGGSTNCDSATDWSPTVTLDTVDYIQGTGSVSIKVSKATVISYFSISGSVDLTSTMIYFWAMTYLISILGTKSGSGLVLHLESSVNNFKEWKIAGKDTWSGEWKCFALHTDTPADTTTGTFNIQATNKIGISWTTTNTAKISPNCFWDGIRYGDGFLSIKGGTDASPATFLDFLTADETTANRWGIIKKTEGIYMLQGNLKIGNATDATYFKNDSEVLVFTVTACTLPLNFYQILIAGNASTFTTVFLGSEVGDSGVSGIGFRTAGTPKYKLLANDQYISTLGIYGSSFFDANTINVPNVYSSNYEVENTSFEGGSLITANVCKFLNCNFISADTIAISLPLDHNCKNSQFINNPSAILVDSGPGTITFDGLKFSGNDYDIEYTGATGETLSVSQVGGSNATTYKCPNGGSVYFLPTQVWLRIYVKDSEGANLSNVQVAIFTDPGMVQCMNELTVDGLAEETYSYTAPQAVTVRVRKQGYVPVYQSGVNITDIGLTVYVTLADDTAYNPT